MLSRALAAEGSGCRVAEAIALGRADMLLSSDCAGRSAEGVDRCLKGLLMVLAALTAKLAMCRRAMNTQAVPQAIKTSTE